MHKRSDKISDELRPEYDLSQLAGGVRGKYLKQFRAGTNLVLLCYTFAKAIVAQTLNLPRRHSCRRMPGARERRVETSLDPAGKVPAKCLRHGAFSSYLAMTTWIDAQISPAIAPWLMRVLDATFEKACELAVAGEAVVEVKG
jgi:hypothetical protein